MKSNNEIEVYHDESFYTIHYEPDGKLNPNLYDYCQHVTDNIMPHALHVQAGGDGFTVCLQCLQKALQDIGILNLL